MYLKFNSVNNMKYNNQTINIIWCIIRSKSVFVFLSIHCSSLTRLSFKLTQGFDIWLHSGINSVYTLSCRHETNNIYSKMNYETKQHRLS